MKYDKCPHCGSKKGCKTFLYRDKCDIYQFDFRFGGKYIDKMYDDYHCHCRICDGYICTYKEMFEKKEKKYENNQCKL